MKRSIRFQVCCLLLPLLPLLFSAGNLKAQEVDPAIKVLEPFLDRLWEGIMVSPDGKDTFLVSRKYELEPGGHIIHFLKENPALGNREEGWFYRDDIAGKIAFFGINSKGVFYRGTVLAEEQAITLEGTMTWPEQTIPGARQSYDFRNRFAFTDENNMTDTWSQNAFGPWRTGHVIAFTARPAFPGYGLLFYSGRTGNQDIFLLPPGQREPVNLTRHPAKDNCPAISPDGKTIVFLSDRTGNTEIFSMNTAGGELKQLTQTPDQEEHPEFSPDGKQIIYVKDFRERTEIWIMNADGTGQQQLTSNPCRDERPFISPDGTRVLFMSNRDGNYEIYTMDISGKVQTRLTDTPWFEIFPAWSPDGKKIVYAQKIIREGKMLGCIRVMNADGTGDISLTAESTRDENPMWSPDGNLIVVQSLRDKDFEIYVMRSDGTEPVRMTFKPGWDGWASFVKQ